MTLETLKNLTADEVIPIESIEKKNFLLPLSVTLIDGLPVDPISKQPTEEMAELWEFAQSRSDIQIEDEKAEEVAEDETVEDTANTDVAYPTY